jgi:hypothetical protein
VGAIALAIALACSIAPRALAQTAVTTGTVGGVVKDTTGGLLAGAAVTAVHVETSRTLKATSDDQGRYRLLALPVGRYEIQAERQGFQPAKTAVTLTVGATLNVQLVLAPANVTEEISVTSHPEVEVQRTQSAETVRPEEIQSLPQNGRNYLDLALLTTGVSRTNTGSVQRFAETSAVPGTGLSVSSQRNIGNTFLVDGLSANDDAAQLAGTFYSEDVIREFQVVSGGGMAEFGRALGGVVNVVTQSGTNQWHGGGYGYFRSSHFDAANALTGRKDPLSQQQFGGSLGGPVRKGATFIFANVEHTNDDQTGLVTISSAAVSAINATLAARQYPGPAIATGSFTSGYASTNVFVRADQDLGGAGRLNLRYSTYAVDSPNSRNAGGLNAVTRGTGLNNRDQTGALNLISTLPGVAVNELRVQFTHSRFDAPVNDPIGPSVSISGVANFGTSTSSPTARDINLFEVSDTLSKQRGSHLFKAGTDLLLDRVNIVFPGATTGSYAFSSLANFVAGRFTTYQQAFGELSQFQSNPNVGLFVQDEWRVRQSVTINAGLRYDVQFLPDPIATDTNNVSPRVGIAIAPGNGKTVIRASGGYYYDPIPLRATSNALQRDGSKYQVAVYATGQAGAPAFPATLPAFPPGLLISVTTIDPHIRDQVSRQAVVQIEREITQGTVATIGYQYLSGHGIIMQRNVNAPTLSAADAAAQGIPNLGRPDPAYANVGRYESLGDSEYNGLIVSIRTRARSWFDGRISYTYSRAYDDAGNFFFSQPQDTNDVRADWGPSDNDQHHRITVSGTASTPHLSGSVLRTVPSDWRISGIVGYSSALPFNVQTGADRNNDTNNNDRPVGVGRNSARGFNFSSVDLRLMRSVPLGRNRLELLVEVFNLFNHANYLVPNNIYGTGTTPLPAFGQPTAVGDPREMQFGVRVIF